MSAHEPGEPERWIVSADAPPELRALLEVARREGPSLVQKTSLGARLGLSATQALVGLSAKGLAVGTIVLAASTGAVFGLYAGSGPSDVQAEVPPAVPARVVEVAPPVPAEEPALPPSVTVESAPAPPALPAPVPPAGKPPSEASLIRAARAALPSGTSQARRLLERHRRLYPQGQLVQEREVLWIEVLEREGRGDEASARAAAFRQQNPESAHRPKAP
jgi:hypothetical protein